MPGIHVEDATETPPNEVVESASEREDIVVLDCVIVNIFGRETGSCVSGMNQTIRLDGVETTCGL